MPRNREAEKDLTDEEFEVLERDWPVGLEVGLDDNICECSQWTAGDSRCSCGNRRITLESGRNGKHIYFYPAAY
mgnify:CR=1 FL=1